MLVNVPVEHTVYRYLPTLTLCPTQKILSLYFFWFKTLIFHQQPIAHTFQMNILLFFKPSQNNFFHRKILSKNKVLKSLKLYFSLKKTLT